jgi:molybdopterin/thiamine biosynthesis adenylyltransferase/rhodanese-related sulfurtransferase
MSINISLLWCTTTLLVMVYVFQRKSLKIKQTNRFSQQRIIVGTDGQRNIEMNGNIIMIGCGGLASGCIPTLIAGGIRKIYLFDGDRVEISNLNRQCIHNMNSLGEFKVISARDYIRKLNPSVMVEIYPKFLETESDLKEIFTKNEFQIMIDCSDNMKTRYLINEICVKHGIPLVSASALRTFGQLAVFWPFKFPKSGCYECTFPRTHDFTPDDGGNCSTDGVLGPIPHILGGFQALETLKLLAFHSEMFKKNPKIGDSQVDSFPVGERMITFDFATLNSDSFHVMKLSQRLNCPICSSGIEMFEKSEDFKKILWKEAISVQPNWFVVDVREEDSDKPYPRTDMRLPISQLRTFPEIFTRKIFQTSLQETTARPTSKPICFICRQGLTSRIAANIFAYQVQMLGLLLDKEQPIEIYSLQGGVGW